MRGHVATHITRQVKRLTNLNTSKLLIVCMASEMAKTPWSPKWLPLRLQWKIESYWLVKVEMQWIIVSRPYSPISLKSWRLVYFLLHLIYYLLVPNGTFLNVHL